MCTGLEQVVQVLTQIFGGGQAQALGAYGRASGGVAPGTPVTPVNAGATGQPVGSGSGPPVMQRDWHPSIPDIRAAPVVVPGQGPPTDPQLNEAFGQQQLSERLKALLNAPK